MSIVKEPWLHFSVAAALLFATYSWLSDGEKEELPAIRITAAEAKRLADIWTRQWRREPTQSELRGLITDHLWRQLLVLEARELGLDENDTVITNRLAQKMEFLIEDTTGLAEPSENELVRLYYANRARYVAPARLSFTQIFFRTEGVALRDLRRLAADPAAAPELADLGDPSLLAREYEWTDAATVTSVFGRDFADHVFVLAPGAWEGPFRSDYGFHLVKVTNRHAARPRAFETVRAEVLEHWRRSEKERARQLLLAELLKKYDVTVEDTLEPLVEPTLSASAGQGFR